MTADVARSSRSTVASSNPRLLRSNHLASHVSSPLGRPPRRAFFPPWAGLRRRGPSSGLSIAGWPSPRAGGGPCKARRADPPEGEGDHPRCTEPARAEEAWGDPFRGVAWGGRRPPDAPWQGRHSMRSLRSWPGAVLDGPRPTAVPGPGEGSHPGRAETPARGLREPQARRARSPARATRPTSSCSGRRRPRGGEHAFGTSRTGRRCSPSCAAFRTTLRHSLVGDAPGSDRGLMRPHALPRTWSTGCSEGQGTSHPPGASLTL